MRCWWMCFSSSVERWAGRELYEQGYCGRGEMENRIKEQQLNLFADRTSPHQMRANQMRLYFASFAYVLMHALRRLGLAGTELARAQCGTIREKVLESWGADSGERSQGVAVDVGELSAGGVVQGGVGATRGDTDSQLAYDLRYWARRVTGVSSRVARRALRSVARRDGPSATLELSCNGLPGMENRRGRLGSRLREVFSDRPSRFRTARGARVASEAAGTRMRRGDAADLLRGHGITPTAQRVDVAAVLLARPQHVCAEDLQRMLARHGTPVSKATVYNTLGLFVRKGLVRELFVDACKVLYDSNTSHHDHVYDVDTGVLTDVEPGAIALGALPVLPPGTRVDSVEIVVRVRRPGRA